VLEAELASTRQQADSAHSTMQIERSARDQLTARIRSLESENSRLREDMLVFESLAGASATGQGFKINRLVLEPDSEAGRYRYRMLIVRQGGKVEQDARGVYEIVAVIEHPGQGANIAQHSGYAEDFQQRDVPALSTDRRCDHGAGGRRCQVDRGPLCAGWSDQGAGDCGNLTRQI
jgi:hypothetical protein